MFYDVTWDDKVRQLKTFGYHTFYYEADGKRCGKNETRYIYQGDKLLREVHQNGDVLTFLYDTAGILGFSFRTNFRNDENGELCYDEKRYFYKKNLQGDVTAIYDELGTKCAEYIYDAWGYCTVTYDRYGISELNPIRYRGYYYDTETDLYYLGSRYYDPKIGRFISPDAVGTLTATPMSLTDKNLYSYCDNNPVVRSDFGGYFWHIAVGAIIGGIVSGIVTAVSTSTSKDGFKLKDTLVSMGVGAIAGGLGVAFPQYALAISSASSAVESVVTDIVDGENILTTVTNAVITAGISVITGGWGDDVSNPNLYDDAIDSISKMKPGNHPKVKNKAKKVIKDALKQANKTAVNDLVIASSSELIGRSTKAVTLCYINMIW